MSCKFQKKFMLVLVIFCLLGVFATPASAATITVCASGCDYTTIQAAIDAAQNGDTISVLAGTYLSGTINVNKSVQIVGIDKTQVFSQAAAPGGYGWNITASGVQVSGLTIQGDGNTLYGVKVSGVDGLRLSNLAVTGYKRSGVDLIGCTNTVLDGINSYQNGGVGIAVSNSINTQLMNVTTTNNAWGGIGLFTNKTYYTANLGDGKTGLDGVILSGVNSLNEANPLYTDLDDPSHVIRNVTQNEFEFLARTTTSAAKTWYQKTLTSAMSLINAIEAVQPGFKVTAAIQKLSDGKFHVLDTLKIQPAIDLSLAGGTVFVYPGTYSEVATNRFVLGTGNGPHQFGLYLGNDKTGLSVIGVNAAGSPITDYTQVAATITTNATNNFGASGIFVEADQVLFQGLRIGPNAPGDNKTFEILGDGFSLRVSHLAIPGGGAVYFGDWRFDQVAQTSHIQAYTIESNWFEHGSQVAFSSGAGYSGPTANRKILNNRFTGNASVNWAQVSFNGYGEVAWYTNPIGPAVISGNSFSGSTEYIRARSIYDNTGFNWKSYWDGNTFENGVVTLIDPVAFDLRPYSYVRSGITFTNVRRIGSVLQKAIDDGQAGDTVLAKAGIFSESITVNKLVHLVGSGSGVDPSANTIIKNPALDPVVTLTGSGLSAANPLSLADVRIVPQGVNGINIPSGSVQFVELNRVALVGPTTRTVENENGLKVATYASLSDLVIKNSLFEYLDYGWYIAKHDDWGPGGSMMRNITVSDTIFRNIDYKGIYAEKLSEAVFTNVSVENCGSSPFWNSQWNGGIDINLKGQETYHDLVFNNLAVKNSGLGFQHGAGLMIKARGSGNDNGGGGAYALHPASLTNVLINGGTFTGNERGIRVGEPGMNNTSPTNVVITGAVIANNVKTYAGSDGSPFGDLVNLTTAAISAENNYWGTLSWYGYDTVKGIKDRIYQVGTVDYIPWSNSAFSATYIIPTETYASVSNAGKVEGAAGASGGVFGYDAFRLVMDAVHHVADLGVIRVDQGVYAEALALPQGRSGLQILGAGAANTILEGVPAGSGFTFELLAPNSVIDGVTIRKAAGSNYGIGIAWSYLGSGSILRNSRIEGHITGVYLASGIDGASVHDNLITGNANGILIEQVGNNISIHNNEIANNNLTDDFWTGKVNAGIRILSGFSGTGNSIWLNSISGSAAGIDNNSGNTILATRNWWGSSTGPKHSGNPGGTGSTLIGSATYNPWLCDGTDSQPAQIGFQPPSDALKCTAGYDRLIFATQPGSSFAGYPLTPQPVLKAVDADGNLGINFNGNVLLTFGNNPVNAVLSGTLFSQAVNGVVTYSGLSINQAGSGFNLVAISDLPLVVSNSFNVLPAESNVGVSLSPVAIVNPFELFSYVIQVNNAGPMAAQNLKVVDTLPEDAAYVSTSAPGWTCDQQGGKVTCEMSSMAKDGSSTITITLRAPFTGGVILTNAVTLSLGTTDPDFANNTASQDTVVPAVLPTGGYQMLLPVLMNQ